MVRNSASPPDSAARPDPAAPPNSTAPLLVRSHSFMPETHLYNEVTVPREVLSVQESDGRGKDLRLPVHLLTAPASHARGKRGGLEHPNSVPAAPLSKGASRGG